MRAIQRQHIVDVYVWVDDAVASTAQTKKETERKGGRPSVLRDSELLTILIWDGLTEPHKTLHGLYAWIAREYGDCFPKLPAYQNFVAMLDKLGVGRKMEVVTVVGVCPPPDTFEQLLRCGERTEQQNGNHLTRGELGVPATS